MIDFPLWLRVAHLLNVIFLTLLIRSGIEILSAHPKLYVKDNATEGKEWIKFTRKKMPKDKLWTSTDEETKFSSWVALPGQSNLGLGRHWHFFSIIFWIGTGAIYYGLLFATGLWETLIPTNWSFFPQAISTMVQMANGHLPPPGNPFDPAQQLAYAGVVFVLGPLMLFTGAAMSPAVAARFPWYAKIFGGRQLARSIHFLCLIGFILFIIVHLTLVVIDNFQSNMANIVFGGGQISLLTAGILFLGYFLVVIVIHAWATEYSLLRPRLVQLGLGAVIEPIRSALFRRTTSHQNFKESQITPYFRVNGRPPETKEYRELARDSFMDYKLTVFGMVENPKEFSIKELKEMEEAEQITEHYCIQGWTAIGKWGGVPMSFILELVRPEAGAKYAVFRSMGNGEKDQFGHGDPSMEYYETLSLDVVKRPQSILAYEMNGKPLPVEHGAPVRLRVETQLGYKQVKWVKSIEIVDDYKKIGDGFGGYREDVQYYGHGAEI